MPKKPKSPEASGPAKQPSPGVCPEAGAQPASGQPRAEPRAVLGGAPPPVEI